MITLFRALRKEDGQVLITMVLSTILIIGMGGLSMDLGRAYYAYRELQASTDAAALAGGYAMGQAGATSATVTTAIDQYSSASGDNNASPDLPGAAVSTVTFTCNSAYQAYAPCNAGLTTSPSCTLNGSNTGCNVVQVAQTATVNTIFLRVLKMMRVNPTQSLTLNSTARALMRGSGVQYNVAVILDSTGSMSQQDTDGNCTGGISKEKCALAGIQTLLTGLTPCGAGSTSSTCASAFDTVAIFTFPNVLQSSASNATTCSGTTPSSMQYSAPAIGGTTYTPSSAQPSYEITSGFLDNYSATNSYNGSIATTSPLGIATGADTGCNGLTNVISGQGTYLAGALYAAQAALTAAQTANKTSENAIVLLTDGDANMTNNLVDSSGKALTSSSTPPLTTTGIYPSKVDQCAQAITAAQYAASHGTNVYVVAYQAGTSGCQTDTADTNPCANLQNMALKAGSTSPYAPYFYSDATTGTKGNGGACPSSANPSLTLNQAFQAVAASFTRSLLIPN
jgi:Flp pilus assembly protein TadG